MNHKIFVFFAAMLFLFPGFAGGAYAAREGIAVVVNEDAISHSDLEDRLRLIMASSGLPNNNEVRAKLVPQVISGLVDEQLMMQEAKRLKIKVAPEEVAEGFAAIARQNNMEPEAFRMMLQKAGINLRTMERQIESQVAWSKVIQVEMRPKVNVTDSDVDAMMERLSANQGETEYLLAEISLPVDDPAREEDTRQLAQRIHSEVGGDMQKFFRMAQQFSGAAGAAQGGDIGWIEASQLEPEAQEELKQLPKGAISRPLRTIGGYQIYLLRDIRQAGGETMPSREQVVNKIGVERLERMQRRHLMDLKAAAFIESRV